eukprot:scaffold5786_cov88-Cylindrotheca_fusiformis.AAC.2
MQPFDGSTNPIGIDCPPSSLQLRMMHCHFDRSSSRIIQWDQEDFVFDIRASTVGCSQAGF